MQDEPISDDFLASNPSKQPDNEAPWVPVVIPAPAFDATPPIVATSPPRATPPIIVASSTVTTPPIIVAPPAATPPSAVAGFPIVTPYPPQPTEYTTPPPTQYPTPLPTEYPTSLSLGEQPTFQPLTTHPPLVTAPNLESQSEMPQMPQTYQAPAPPQTPVAYQASTLPQMSVAYQAPMAQQLPTAPQAPVAQTTQGLAENTEPPTAKTAPKKARPKKGKSRSKARNKQIILIALRDLGITMALLFIVLQFFSPTIVRERSMENTLMPNEILYVTKQAYWFGPPGYNDIIIFGTKLQDSNGSDKSLVKRIIGLPGDRISIQGGSVFRNGERLVEPYTKSGTTPGTLQEVTVPENAYFVLGDNREVSRDSRSADVGFVNKGQIQGQVLLRAFPLDKFTVF